MDRRESIIDLTSAPALAPESTSWDITSVDFNTDSGSSGYGSISPPIVGNIRSRGVKRQRSGDETENAGPSSRPRVEEQVQAIDLTEVDSSSELAKTLSNLREDAVKAQQPSENETSKSQSILGAYKCPVCMDTPEDATSTACGMFRLEDRQFGLIVQGHLFCHRCILECLATADARTSDSNKNKGTCPVCRKPITKNDTPGPRRSLIPLKLKLTTKKRNVIPPTEA